MNSIKIMLLTINIVTSVLLTVMATKAPLNLSIPVSFYTPTVGSPTTLQCVISSGIPTSIAWYKDGTVLNLANHSRYFDGDLSKPSLTINPVQQIDAGNYVCRANTGLISTITEPINVYPQYQVTVNVSQASYTVASGLSVTLICSVTSNRDILSVHWQKNDGSSTKNIYHNSNTKKYIGSSIVTPSLTVLNADRNDDAFYRCLVVTASGKGQSSLTKLTVSGELPIVTMDSVDFVSVLPGNSVTLGCSVNSNLPIISVYWKVEHSFGIKTIDQNTDNSKYGGSTKTDPSLQINQVLYSDEGQYTCFAGNSFGIGQSSTISLIALNGYISVSVLQTSILANYGHSVTLTCTVSTYDPTSTKVYWEKNKNSTLTTIDVYTKPDKYILVNEETLVHTLEIIDTEGNDEGVYRCIVRNNFMTRSISSSDITLTVKEIVDAPITSYLQNIGLSVTLQCVVGLANIDSISWYKDGIPLDVSTDNRYSDGTNAAPSLTINSVQLDDAGNYICRVNSGDISAVTDTIYVNPRVQPTVDVQQSAYTVTAGQSVTLVCSVISDREVINVYWRRSIGAMTKTIALYSNTDKYVGSTANNPSLTIFNTDSGDNGNYTCFARTILGTGQGSAISLFVGIENAPIVVVLQPRYTVTVGGSITLACVVQSVEVVTNVYWQVYDQIINLNITSQRNKYSGSTPSNPSLTIHFAELVDIGNYACFASTSLGTGQSLPTFLDVIDIPRVTSPLQTYLSAVYFSNVILECHYSANPPATQVRWERIINGRTVDIGDVANSNKYSGSTITTSHLTIYHLTIYGVDMNDEGFYRCKVSNVVGTGISDTDIYLDVIGSIPMVEAASTHYSVNIGNSVTLQCSVQSNPIHTNVKWQRVDAGGNAVDVDMTNNRYSGSSVGSPSLVISNTNISDEGFYFCLASNSVGIGQSQRMYLRVIDDILDVPSVTVSAPRSPVYSGSTVTLKCTYSAIPLAHQVKWERTVNGNTVDIGDTATSKKYGGSTVESPSLIIYKAAESDEGSYRCKVSNTVGTGTSIAVTLALFKSSPIITVREGSYRIKEEKSVTLDCKIESTSALTLVFWQKVLGGTAKTIQTGIDKYEGSSVMFPSLIINNTASSDSGSYYCYAINSIGIGQSSKVVLAVTELKNNEICDEDTDWYGLFWNQTNKITTAVLQCDGDRTGSVTRVCDGEGMWEDPDYTNCIRTDLLNLDNELENLISGTGSSRGVTAIIKELATITNTEEDDNLVSGDLEISADILNNVAEYVSDEKTFLTFDELEAFVDSCNNLLQGTTVPGWLQLKTKEKKGVTQLAKAVPVFTKAFMQPYHTMFDRVVLKENLVVQTGKTSPRTLVFPDSTRSLLPSWISDDGTKVLLRNESLKGDSLFGYSFVYYRNVSDLFHEYRMQSGEVVFNNDILVNSAVVDFSIEPEPEKLDPPLTISFKHTESGFKRPDCVFWNFDARNTPNGAWSTSGSELIETSNTRTTCHFYHTTNFAIIMSPSETPEAHRSALSVISLVGCGVSIAFLTLTVVIYALLWRKVTMDKRGHIKRDSAITLMNFCVALILSYAIFLSGIKQTGNKGAAGISIFCPYKSRNRENNVNLRKSRSQRTQTK